MSRMTTSKPSSAIKIDHLPFGFFEKEISSYFSQFGSVVRVRVPRCKKSGRDRGYAFVLFNDSTVAQIAMEAMDGYLMFNKRLVVTVLDESKVPDVLKKGGKIVNQPSKGAMARVHTKKMNAVRSEKADITAKVRRSKLQAKRMKKLAAMGIEYDMDGERKIDMTEVTVVEQEPEKDESVPVAVEPTPKRAKLSGKKGAATPAAAATTQSKSPKTPLSAKKTPPLKSRLRSAARK